MLFNITPTRRQNGEDAGRVLQAEAAVPPAQEAPVVHLCCRGVLRQETGISCYCSIVITTVCLPDANI